MKIYDCFGFFNELDLLELRLEILAPIVDHFVIIEYTVTYKGDPKPLYYNENKERYKKFENKIIHQIIDDVPMDYINLSVDMGKDKLHKQVIDRVIKMTHFPKTHVPYGINSYGKECVIRALGECTDGDIIMYSDLDEIPNNITVQQILENFDHKKIYNLRQKMYYYYMNCEKNEVWNGGWLMDWYNFKEIPVSEQKVKRYGEFIDNGGWHFGFLGGIEGIKTKMLTCDEPSFDIPELLKNIEYRVENCQTCGVDIYGRPAQFKFVGIEEMPQYVQDNYEKYKEYFRFK